MLLPSARESSLGSPASSAFNATLFNMSTGASCERLGPLGHKNQGAVYTIDKAKASVCRFVHQGARAAAGAGQPKSAGIPDEGGGTIRELRARTMQS